MSYVLVFACVAAVWVILSLIGSENAALPADSKSPSPPSAPADAPHA